MATINLSASASNQRAIALLNAIGGAAELRLYTGSIPASPDSAPTGTLLASLTGPTPFGIVVGTTITAGTIPQSTGLATGVAGYLRILNSSGQAVVDLDVSTGGGTGAVVVNAPIRANAPVLLSGITFTEAN